MKNNKLLSLTLAIIAVLINSTSVYAFTAPQPSENTNTKTIYLSENEVFECLAYTFADEELQAVIKSETQLSPSGAYLKNFNASDYSKYTAGQYGGMYINDNGVLTICYAENFESKNMEYLINSAKLKNNTVVSLKNSDNKTVVEQCTFKAVQYSEADLLSAYEIANKVATKNDNIKSVCIDYYNNRLIIELESMEYFNKLRIDLSSIEGMYAIEIIDEDDEYHDIATINGTSQINNGTISSTPAGMLYCSEFTAYGVVTCGHGWAVNNNVFFGTTQIGTIRYRQYNGTNDSSLFLLDNNHSYKDTKNNEIDSRIPVVGSTLTLRGYVSGIVNDAKVTSTNTSATTDGTYFTGMIKCDKAMAAGDSGGGAIGGYIDLGKTAVIVGINKAVNSSSTLLIKGQVICDAY